MPLEYICQWCGTPFLGKPSDAPKFCSRACYLADHKGRPPRPAVPLAERFLAKFQIGSPADCWEWQAYRTEFGYGMIGQGGRGAPMLFAHRVSYEHFVGEIPAGMFVLHHCDNPSCVNPAHLFLGTLRDNALDMVAKGRRADIKGEDHANAKLTGNDVQDILNSTDTGRSLAMKYSVSPATISLIRSGKRWNHVHTSSQR